MNTYAESSYKTKNSPAIFVVRMVVMAITLFILLFVVLTKLTLFTFFVGLFVVILLIVEYFGFSRINSEYEVVYCDGQFDFDRISGITGRKTLFRIDMEQVKMIAPYGHEALLAYPNAPVKKKMIPGKPEDSYVIILENEKTGLSRILFYPNEKMLECIYNKAPSKLKK